MQTAKTVIQHDLDVSPILYVRLIAAVRFAFSYRFEQFAWESACTELKQSLVTESKTAVALSVVPNFYRASACIVYARRARYCNGKSVRPSVRQSHSGHTPSLRDIGVVRCLSVSHSSIQ